MGAFIKMKQYSYLWIIGMVICFFIIMLFISTPEKKSEQLEKLVFFGQYKEDGGQWKPLNSHTKLNTYRSRQLHLRGNFNKTIYPQQRILLNINYLEVHLKKTASSFILMEKSILILQL